MSPPRRRCAARRRCVPEALYVLTGRLAGYTQVEAHQDVEDTGAPVEVEEDHGITPLQPTRDVPRPGVISSDASISGTSSG